MNPCNFFHMPSFPFIWSLIISHVFRVLWLCAFFLSKNVEEKQVVRNVDPLSYYILYLVNQPYYFLHITIFIFINKMYNYFLQENHFFTLTQNTTNFNNRMHMTRPVDSESSCWTTPQDVATISTNRGFTYCTVEFVAI